MNSSKAYRLAYERGYRAMVPVHRARNHLADLERCIGRPATAMLCGLSEQTLYQIAKGNRKKIRRVNEDAILRVWPEDADLLATDANVDATASRRRVEALVALGYPKGWVAQQLGRNRPDLELRDQITRRRALAILALCERVGDTPGPSRRVRATARRLGWLCPAEYDDRLYDPHWNGLGLRENECEADQDHFERLVEDYLFIRRTSPAHTTEAAIAERMGISPKRLDWVRKLAAREAA